MVPKNFSFSQINLTADFSGLKSELYNPVLMFLTRTMRYHWSAVLLSRATEPK